MHKGDSTESQNSRNSWLYSNSEVTKDIYGECPDKFKKDFRKQNITPQPHFKPGYTGYVPGALYHNTGLTYGYSTKKLLEEHRVGGNRLNRIPGDIYITLQVQPNTTEDNPHKIPQPYFIPGYTGFTPGSGIRRSEGFGETYGKMTHVMLEKHFLKGGRLRPVYEYPPEFVAKEEDIKFYNYEHELTRSDLKRKTKVVPGYGGHIPRAIFRHGKNGTQIAEESIAEFQQILNKNQ